jgi:hypothetical protein
VRDVETAHGESRGPLVSLPHACASYSSLPDKVIGIQKKRS